MDKIQENVQRSAAFYDRYLNFDYQLSDFGFQKIKPFFKGKLALEIGPANGYMTKSLITEFNELHLLEGSEELLNKIPDYGNIIKHHSMLEDFETTLKFDTIIMSHVLEHISEPVNALKRIHHLLKSDGVFLVSVPNAKSIHRMVAVQMGLLPNEYELNERDFGLGHYRVYDTEILKNHLVEAGFKIFKNGGYFLKPLTNSQIEEYWNEEMIQGFYNVGEYFQDNCAEIFAVCNK